MIPDGTAKNPPLVRSEFLVILHWWRTDSQAFESHSQNLEAVERDISGGSIRVTSDFEQVQVAQQQIHLNSHRDF